MSVSIYDGTNDVLNQIAGREDVSFWEGTQAQWNALSSADKALWTGKYVIITDDEDSGVFTGATSSTDGSVGYVPAPLAGDENKFLKGDGNWTQLINKGSFRAEVTANTVNKIIDYNYTPTSQFISGTYPANLNNAVFQINYASITNRHLTNVNLDVATTGVALYIVTDVTQTVGFKWYEFL